MALGTQPFHGQRLAVVVVMAVDFGRSVFRKPWLASTLFASRWPYKKPLLDGRTNGPVSIVVTHFFVPSGTACAGDACAVGSCSKTALAAFTIHRILSRSSSLKSSALHHRSDPSISMYGSSVLPL